MKNYKKVIGFLLILGLIYLKEINHFTVQNFANLFSKQTELVISDYKGPLFLTIINEKAAYIDTTGRIILKTKYDNRSGEFICGRAKVYNQDNKYGFIDSSGKLAVDFKYVKRNDFEFTSEFTDNHAIVFDGNEYKLIDTFGNEKFTIRQNALISNPCNGFITIGEPSQRGVADYKGKGIIPIKYRFIRDFSDGLFVIQLQNKKFGAIDSLNNFVVDTVFEDIERFNYGLAPAKIDGKWGVINKKGKFIVKPTFDEITSYSESLAKVVQNGKYGYIDTLGVLKIPIKNENAFNPFANMHDFHNGLATFKAGNKWGFINKVGKITIQPIFLGVRDFKNGIAWVKFDNKDSDDFGFINTKGNIIYRNKK